MNTPVGPGFLYQGAELKIFEHAVNWKRYWSTSIRQWIRGNVLEVGAGLGVNTSVLRTDDAVHWTCLEPDPEMAGALQEKTASMPGVEAKCGTVQDLPKVACFDSVLYIDVLEHIENDREELAAAASRLLPGGHIVVLSPAHQFLYSPFDAAIGHFRRYNKPSLRACSPPACRIEAMFYLDSVGMLASAANCLMLRQRLPTLAQIKTWDRYLVPVSRIVDPSIGRLAGKTIVGVWTRNNSEVLGGL
jgi:SAM-dependent methyltransferase